MIYLFCGDDRFTLQEELKKLKQENIPPEAEEFNFCKLDAARSGFSVDEVFNACDAFPFLSDKRVVVVSELVSKLGKTAASEERAAARGTGKAAKARSTTAPASPRERFLDFVSQVPSTAVLVLVEDKVAKNDVIYKAIDKHGAVRQFEPPKDWALEKWINERAVKQKVKLDRAVPALLRDYLGSDLHRIANELEKLAAYAGEGQMVTGVMVEMLTAEVKETQVWAITDAIAGCDLRQALELLSRLRNETNLTKAGFTRQMFAIIGKQIYDLMRIREMYAARKNVNEIAQATGMHPFRVEKTLPLTRNFSAERLDRIYASLTELDFADKSGKADLSTRLELMLADICQKS